MRFIGEVTNLGGQERLQVVQTLDQELVALVPEVQQFFAQILVVRRGQLVQRIHVDHKGRELSASAEQAAEVRLIRRPRSIQGIRQRFSLRHNPHVSFFQKMETSYTLDLPRLLPLASPPGVYAPFPGPTNGTNASPSPTYPPPPLDSQPST